MLALAHTPLCVGRHRGTWPLEREPQTTTTVGLRLVVVVVWCWDPFHQYFERVQAAATHQTPLLDDGVFGYNELAKRLGISIRGSWLDFVFHNLHKKHNFETIAVCVSSVRMCIHLGGLF